MLFKRFSILFVTVIFVVLIGNVNAYCESGGEIFSEESSIDIKFIEALKKYEILDSDFGEYDSAEEVSRDDCLRGILKAAGMHVDGYFDSGKADIEQVFADEDYAKDKSYLNFGYIYRIMSGQKVQKEKKIPGEPQKLWLFGELIVNGKVREYNEPVDMNREYFFPLRTATVNDCIAFIMRCIDKNAEGLDLEGTFQLAKERGIIKESDNFYNDGNRDLNQEIFFTLLKRMMNEKRYIYFRKLTDKDIWWECDGRLYDETGEMTYLEYMQSLYD